MLFTEGVFISEFLPIVVVGFILLQIARQPLVRSIWLIAASVIFYAWFKLEYLPILIGSVLVNYFLARGILSTGNKSISRMLMIIGIVGNLGLLGVYKYLGFITINLNAFLEVGLPEPKILLPLAISFFTFQQISYLVDAHTEKLELEDHRFVDYMLFVTFFPQLVAGPIVHHSEMMPQFRTLKKFQERILLFAEGLFLFSCGLFKKLVIADSVAPTADQMFSMVDAGTAIGILAAWTGALAYTFQIYFDFSGYSDMAIGLGLLFGIRLPWNFNSPYKARNISEFWRRWHMSLSRWLRDYLYIPLGGNRHGKFKQYRNNFLTMVLGGLWHGAHWNFVIWGALHGVYLIINQLIRGAIGETRREISKIEAVGAMVSGIAFTFLATVVAWVFFRATTTQGAFSMLQSMFGMNGTQAVDVNIELKVLLMILIAALVAFFAPNTKQFSEKFGDLFKAGRPAFSWRILSGGMAGAAAALALIASQSTTQSPFLYFNF